MISTRRLLDKGATELAPRASVQVLERKQVGAYDVAVLKATGSGALMEWLKTNRFAVPPSLCDGASRD